MGSLHSTLHFALNARASRPNIVTTDLVCRGRYHSITCTAPVLLSPVQHLLHQPVLVVVAEPLRGADQ